MRSRERRRDILAALGPTARRPPPRTALLVDVTEFVLLVTEFLLSFVGTRAGRKLSSDIDFSFSEPPVS